MGHLALEILEFAAGIVRTIAAEIHTLFGGTKYDGEQDERLQIIGYHVTELTAITRITGGFL